MARCIAPCAGIDPAGPVCRARSAAHRPFTDVLVFTTGNAPMQLTLSFCPPGASRADHSAYEVRSALRVELSCGTLFVLSHVDDLFYKHQAEFTESVLDQHLDGGGYRIALVFRWLRDTQAREFFASPSGKFTSCTVRPNLWDQCMMMKRRKL